MNPELNLMPSESIDVDRDEESSDNKKKIPICERCWIFKRNKNFVQRKCTRGRVSAEDYNVDAMNRYDEHKRFLAHLVEFQQSLPYQKMEKPVVVNQLTSDSAEMKNIFVNNAITPNGNFNLKAFEGPTNKKKHADNNLSSRSLRLNRKCKINNLHYESDEDFLLGKNISRQNKVNRYRDIVPDVNNKEVVNTVSLSGKARVETEGNPANPLDELLGDKVVEPVKNKKRKTEEGNNNNFVSDIRNMAKKFVSKLPVCDRLTTKKTVNGEGKENTKYVIEIDGENGVRESEPKNREETNKEMKVSCPMCCKFFSSEEINTHAYTCQGPQTLTRSQQSKKGVPAKLNVNYSTRAWESACKGLDIDWKTVPKKQKGPVEHIDMVAETNIFHVNEGKTPSVPSKQNNLKNLEDPLKDVSVSSKVCEPKNERLNDYELHCEKQHNRLKTSKISGYKNFDNQSTQDLIEGYARTIHKNKNPPAKQLRSFGEQCNTNHEMVKCGRCDQHVADDQLKSHTDHCLESSIID